MSLTQIGLLFDIAGALILARAIAFTNIDLLIEKSATSWDYNEETLYGLCEQRIDGRFGLALILTGFTVQLFGRDFYEYLWQLKVFLLIILITVSIGYVSLRNFLVNYVFEKTKKKANRRNNK